MIDFVCMKPRIKVYDSKEGYDLAASLYDQKEAYLNSFEKGQLLKMIGNVAGENILEVGAGTGRTTGDLLRLGANVTALDLSDKMLEQLKRKHPKAEIIVGDAESLSFPENCFDWVIASFLVVHLSDPTRFFDEAYRILKDGGKLLITNINQKEAPEVKTKDGIIKIDSYYHRPEEVKKKLTDLAYSIEKEVIVKEGDVWINQIIVAKK